MIEQTPGVSRLVDRLVAKGLVTRTRGELDLRHVICRLTPAGMDLLARTETPIDEADDFMLSGLNQRKLGALIDLLDQDRSVMTPPTEQAATVKPRLASVSTAAAGRAVRAPKARSPRRSA
jgi:hypothetical protein